MAFAWAPLFVEISPGFTLEDIFDGSHPHFIPKDLFRRRPMYEILVSRICLNLEPQIGSRLCQIEAVLEFLYFEALHGGFFAYVIQTLVANDDVQIEAHHRLNIGIDGQTADHAITGAGLLKNV